MRIVSSAAAALAALVASGAAAAPPTAPAPALDCEQVLVEIARTEHARRKAADDADNAWKAVVPFVVLARKAQARSAVEQADKRLAELRPQRSPLCEGPRPTAEAVASFN